MAAGETGGGQGFGGWLIRLAPTDAGRKPELSVLPLDHGPPPQLAEFRDCRCVLDGVVHDRDALARAAGAELPRDASPAEAIIHAYLRLGERVLEHVKGVFAFAVWDGEVLLCARDRLGIYPLFRAEARDGGLLVSTSIRALLAQPGASRGVNTPVLVDHLRHRWLDTEGTFFEAVRRIPPGHALTASDGTRRVFRYWDPAPPDKPVTWIRTDELDRFDDLLQAAVDRCIRAGETGIFLSGGLDSVSVAALASSRTAKPTALSLAFPDPSVNEEDVQRNVASQLGLPQVLLDWDEAVGPQGLVAASLELTSGLAAPLINLWAPAYDQLVLRGRSRGCRVIVTGTGGDEWLGVSPFYAADLIRQLDVAGLVRLFQSLRRSYPLSPQRHLANVLWRFGTRPLLRRAAVRALAGPLTTRKRRRAPTAIPPWLAPSDEVRRELVERDLDAYARSLRPMRRLGRGHPAVYIEEMRTALGHPLVSMEFEETFEQGRRLGVSFLHPFLDADLIEFLYRTPPELLNRGGRSKGLVREALARRLPQFGFEVQRKVVATQFGRSLMAREAPRAWRAAGGVPGLVAAGIVGAEEAEKLVDRLSGGPPGAEHFKLWDLLSSDRWFRSNGEKEL